MPDVADDVVGLADCGDAALAGRSAGLLSRDASAKPFAERGAHRRGLGALIGCGRLLGRGRLRRRPPCRGRCRELVRGRCRELVRGRCRELVRGRCRDLDRTAVHDLRHLGVADRRTPVAHIADVEMHEGRARGRIVADAAALQAQPDIAQLFQRRAGDIEVHRLAEHVLAVIGDAVAARPQHRVGGRRTIAAHDVDDLVAADLAGRFPDEVVEARIHRDLFVLAPVAHEPVELLQRILVVTAVALIGDRDVFVGVDVMERDRPGVAVRDRRLEAAAAEEQRERRERRAAIKLARV